MWTARFAPLTLLYPLLQAEGLGEVYPVRARRATLAHHFILVHAFLDDRREDRQIELDPQEIEFMERMLSEGVALLDEIGDDSDAVAKITDAFVQSYRASQHASFVDPKAPGEMLAPSRVWSIAATRAAYGALSVLILAGSSKCTERALRVIKNAFDALVVGLQWADDLEDWREDLEVGDENLLLLMLRQSGPDPYAHPDDGLRIANVGHALAEHAIMSHAVDQARRHFEFAARRQRSLGCPTLVGLIEGNIARLDGLERRHVVRVGVEVLDRLLAPASKTR